MGETTRPAGGPVFRLVSVVGVSAYLIVVYSWLVLRRRLQPAGFVRHAWSRLKPRYRGALTDVRPEVGHCFVAPLPSHLRSDQDGFSRLCVLEDGELLAHAHAAHDDIREHGGGRFSHWGDALYFSTPDNSDPSTNGRTYRVEER